LLFLKEFLHKNTASFSFLFVCMSETNNEKTNHFQSKLCLDFILFLRTDLWFQIPKLFKKSCLKVSRKIFPFKEKITSFQYNYSTRSLFCQFLPPGSHSWVICRMVWMTHNKFFLPTQKFWPFVWWACDGNNFIFFILGQFLHPLTFNELGKILHFFFFHRTRKCV